jgi:hypothetical protein
VDRLAPRPLRGGEHGGRVDGRRRVRRGGQQRRRDALVAQAQEEQADAGFAPHEAGVGGRRAGALGVAAVLAPRGEHAVGRLVLQPALAQRVGGVQPFVAARDLRRAHRRPGDAHAAPVEAERAGLQALPLRDRVAQRGGCDPAGLRIAGDAVQLTQEQRDARAAQVQRWSRRPRVDAGDGGVRVVGDVELPSAALAVRQCRARDAASEQVDGFQQQGGRVQVRARRIERNPRRAG